MNAPTYIEKNLGKKREDERRMEMHAKKLKEIQAKEVKKKKLVDDNYSSKIKETKTKTKGFMKNEKNAEINRENQILLNKLVEISNGKWSSVSKPVVKKKAKPVGPPKKSLNYERRKKEFERIERENMAIAQRLFNKQGSISKKKMDAEYGVHKKYKKQIQKAEPTAKGTIKGKTKGKKGEDEHDENKKTTSDNGQVEEEKSEGDDQEQKPNREEAVTPDDEEFGKNHRETTKEDPPVDEKPKEAAPAAEEKITPKAEVTEDKKPDEDKDSKKQDDNDAKSDAKDEKSDAKDDK